MKTKRWINKISLFKKVDPVYKLYSKTYKDRVLHRLEIGTLMYYWISVGKVSRIYLRTRRNKPWIEQVGYANNIEHFLMYANRHCLTGEPNNNISELETSGHRSWKKNPR